MSGRYPWNNTCRCRGRCIDWRKPGEYLHFRFPNGTGAFTFLNDWFMLPFDPTWAGSCRWIVVETGIPVPLGHVILQYNISTLPYPFDVCRGLHVEIHGSFGVPTIAFGWSLCSEVWDCTQPMVNFFQVDFPPSTDYPAGSSTGDELEIRWGTEEGPTS